MDQITMADAALADYVVDLPEDQWERFTGCLAWISPQAPVCGRERAAGALCGEHHRAALASRRIAQERVRRLVWG